jgi:hypothetical protein
MLLAVAHALTPTVYGVLAVRPVMVHPNAAEAPVQVKLPGLVVAV